MYCRTVFVRLMHAVNVYLLPLCWTRYSNAERRVILEEQSKNNVFHRFIDGKAIIKQGFLDKRKVRKLSTFTMIFLMCFQYCKVAYVEECQDLLKQYEDWWPRHSRPSHRITWCSSLASLGRTDVKDEFHALKPEELGTVTSAWCCSTTTQVNTSISQCQCRCRSSHPGC